jgi:hypothetical protein
MEALRAELNVLRIRSGWRLGGNDRAEEERVGGEQRFASAGRPPG